MGRRGCDRHFRFGRDAIVHGNITLATGNRLYIGDPTENTDAVYFSRSFNVPDETLTSLVLGDNATAPGLDAFGVKPTPLGAM